ncbi:c-type cytochrome biogenesis protein CcmI/CycH [Nitrospina watsonii]|uniref:Cytochrome c-type biogenesis protein H Ig-like domain-containing protein n=1 Tax=Nitrospina watsonii TaxID=1323948 RepID=A0ABN8W3W7_9BACT|nr:hypothetical protein [Nitrospina watsonii]CAI2719708.1 conserved protein of unknown function [Nitrospina watsonii]
MSKKLLNMKFIIKLLLILGLLSTVFFLAACERDLKEHKVPPAVVEKLAKKNDPALQAQAVEGVVTLAPGQAPRVTEAAVLFLYARPRGVESGPPLAVKKINFFTFPMEYSLGPAEVMLAGTSFEGPLTVSARLDLDGDPKAQPGDLEGRIDVEPGNKQANIVLGEVMSTGKEITGTLSVSPKLQSHLPQTPVLFILARPHGVKTGAPLAVKRVIGVEFPYAFRIGQADTMLPDVEFDGPVTLLFRLDNDGNLKSTPGDMEGEANANAGDENIEVVMETLVAG